MRLILFSTHVGAAYGSLVCSVCIKNVTFELESQSNLTMYGEGARVLNMLGAPKPPNVERKKPDGDAALNDKTL
jgi:hypothetical protein